MQEVFEKIKERLKNELHLAKEDGERYLKGNSNQFLYARARGYEVAMENASEIVNQVAKEYVPDINVGDIWKIVYDKVLELEKEYAMSGDIKNVNDCIRLENLLQYFKEELREENNQSLTNGGWIPVSERLPKGKETHKVLVTDKDGIMAVCYFLKVAKVFKVCWDGEEFQEAIAWRSLPEPYKPEGE